MNYHGKLGFILCTSLGQLLKAIFTKYFVNANFFRTLLVGIQKYIRMDILPFHSHVIVSFWKFPSSLSKINTNLILEAVCKIDSAYHAFALKM